jgi:hypothetical protein
METKKATIKREELQTSLILEGNSETFEIILTDDNPNNIKNVFNNLLKNLKKGLFKFELEDTKQDMFHHICVEYLLQLNSEIETIYQELDEFELTEEEQSEQIETEQVEIKE